MHLANGAVLQFAAAQEVGKGRLVQFFSIEGFIGLRWFLFQTEFD